MRSKKKDYLCIEFSLTIGFGLTFGVFELSYFYDIQHFIVKRIRRSRDGVALFFCILTAI